MGTICGPNPSQTPNRPTHYLWDIASHKVLNKSPNTSTSQTTLGQKTFTSHQVHQGPTFPTLNLSPKETENWMLLKGSQLRTPRNFTLKGRCGLCLSPHAPHLGLTLCSLISTLITATLTTFTRRENMSGPTHLTSQVSLTSSVTKTFSFPTPWSSVPRTRFSGTALLTTLF